MHEVQWVRSATIKDVAERAGVSLKTVWRVINNEPSVHARTREKVQREIDALGYQPDPSARSLRSTRSYALGLVYDNPNAHYIINLQRGVLSVCRSRLSTVRRIASPQVCQPLAHSAPNMERRPASSSRWKGCGS